MRWWGRGLGAVIECSTCRVEIDRKVPLPQVEDLIRRLKKRGVIS